MSDADAHIRYIDAALAAAPVLPSPDTDFERFVVAAIRARGIAASREAEEARARWFRSEPTAVMRAFALEELLARKIALYVHGSSVPQGEEMIRRATASYLSWGACRAP